MSKDQNEIRHFLNEAQKQCIDALSEIRKTIEKIDKGQQVETGDLINMNGYIENTRAFADDTFNKILLG